VGGQGDADAGVFDAGGCQTAPGFAGDRISDMGYWRRREVEGGRRASPEMGDGIWDMGRWVKMKIKERLQATGYRNAGSRRGFGEGNQYRKKLQIAKRSPR